MNFDELIDKTVSYCDKPLTLDRTLNVAYCFDDNYALYCGVSLFSLLEHNKNINVVVHLFAVSLSIDNQWRFKEMADKFDNVQLYIYHVNNDFQISEDYQADYPLSMLLRIMVPDILKDKCDYFLYLDGDTLVVSQLDGLLDYQNDKVVSAVIDFAFFLMPLPRVQFHHDLYFNSGVLFVNVKSWIEQDITYKVLDLLVKNHYTYPDQDALNTILSMNCNYLPTTYNEHSDMLLKNYINKSDKNTKIMHFAGETKKYYIAYRTPLYQSYLDKTPWSKVNTNYNNQVIAERKNYAKNLKKTNKFKFLIYYLIYKFYKVTKKFKR